MYYNNYSDLYLMITRCHKKLCSDAILLVTDYMYFKRFIKNCIEAHKILSILVTPVPFLYNNYASIRFYWVKRR